MKSLIVTIAAAFSAAVVPVPADLLLFVLLDSFSALPAMTKSAFLTSFLCLLLIKNQNRPNEASSTTTTGTTIAGISVLRFDEDFSAAADEVAEGVLEDVREDEEVSAASAEVSALYWDASVTADVMTVVLLEISVPPELGSTNVCVVIKVVNADAEGAKVRGPAPSVGALKVIEAGRFAVSNCAAL